MEEKLLILKMLQEEKISADDAVKLLEALEKSSTGTSSSGSRINEIKDELTAKLNEMKIDEKLNKFGEKASKLAATFGEKAEKLVEQLGDSINAEKIENSTEKFTEEFTKRIETLGQDIAESAVKFADAFADQLGSLFDTINDQYRYNSNYTYTAENIHDIYLETDNFFVKVGPNDKKEIKVNISANSNIPQLVIDEYFKAIKDTDSYTLSSEFPGRTWGRIDILIPKDINMLKISTNNAKCEISDIDVKNLSCVTANGKISLARCHTDNIEAYTDNEKVILNKISTRTASIRTSNSKILIENSLLDNIDAKTSNAAIMVNASRKGDSLSSCYTLSTSNGKIDLGLAKEESYEHMVDAHTTMSSVEVKLANLSYETDKKSIKMQETIQLKSEGFDTASNKISIIANTLNAPISIKNI
ncbi:MAG: DUF4097 family beta strand repeat protein [Gracilibacteraceae bacterium]|jgi:DUF4097 and DUF4098 domain-containing protein YvlB|nr:DUF4097 family beta strand repeat protein [Gracilibacteraceae bacterium]